MVFACPATFSAERTGPLVERLQALMGLLQNLENSLEKSMKPCLGYNRIHARTSEVTSCCFHGTVLVDMKQKDGTLYNLDKTNGKSTFGRVVHLFTISSCLLPKAAKGCGQKKIKHGIYRKRFHKADRWACYML